MTHRKKGAPPLGAGRSAMRMALARKLEGEYDRLTVMALGLLFQPATRETGRGMIAELYRGHHKHDNTPAGAGAATIPVVHEIVASMVVREFPPQQAYLLWGAIPGPCLLDTLGSVLVHALMDEDAGWIRAAREKIEDLRQHDKRHASNGRVAVLCGDVAKGLRDFWSDRLPAGPLNTASWQRCLSWMVERMVVGMFDEHSMRSERPGTTQPDPLLLGRAEWLASSLGVETMRFDLAIGQALGKIHAPSYPTLAAWGADIRRAHLEGGLQVARGQAGRRQAEPGRVRRDTTSSVAPDDTAVRQL